MLRQRSREILTLASISMRCSCCQRSCLLVHDEFVAFHRCERTTTFLLINTRLRCVACGQKNGQCCSEMHGSDARKAYPLVRSRVEGPQPARRSFKLLPSRAASAGRSLAMWTHRLSYEREGLHWNDQTS